MATCRVAGDQLRSNIMQQPPDHQRQPDSQLHALPIQMARLFEMNKHSVAILGLLMVVQSLLLVITANSTSATVDEPAHLAAGVSYYDLHNFGLYRVNPPLVRLVAAFPSFWVGCKTTFIDSVLVGCITLLVLNLGYGLQGTATPLGDVVPLKSRWLAANETHDAGAVYNNRFSATWAGAIPVPVPADFLRGCDLQA